MSAPTTTVNHATCPLCSGDGGVPIWRGTEFRVIRAEEVAFPAFYRVVWNDHVAEFSDLSVVQRHTCMEAVSAVERVMRRHLHPDKINLAALGNMVPHLHWHVVARFGWDSHFPGSPWSAPVRAADAAQLAAVRARLPQLDAAVAAVMS